MKIYLFNPDNGIYLGEDFADEEPMKRGTFSVPRDATTIAPPEAKPGETPFFDIESQRWELRRLRDLSGDNGLYRM